MLLPFSADDLELLNFELLIVAKKILGKLLGIFSPCVKDLYRILESVSCTFLITFFYNH